MLLFYIDFATYYLLLPVSECNCNGFSNRCYFDEKLYELTGHGGHCLDCTANRDGPNCERCRENYYMREDGFCIACDCNKIGSRSLQCNSEGKCQCKSGVTGAKCDQCEVNFYDFTTQGCKTCGCLDTGSVSNQPNCDPYSGICACKENVEGKQCSECKPGYFNLDFENEFGCTPCFCYGHSSKCNSAPGFSKYITESTFARSSERWSAEDEYGRAVEIKYDGISQTIAVQALGDEVVYFLAPERFLGDQRMSYNQLLEFVLRIGDNRPIPTATDIILEGGGASVTNTIFAQQNKIPTIQNQIYKFRLHEHPKYGWQPRLSARSFISILTNLTSIKIKGTFTPQGVGFLDNVRIETASKAPGEPALWVESCDCPEGYVGQFCESCAPGFRHSPARGGPFMPCVPCDCNNHASICDSETGRCICSHNTTGENCELCARGFYGNALGGTPNDCSPCGCPRGGACIQLDDDVIVCTECPVEYTGPRCELCADGYYGDPSGRFGTPTPCRTCACNENVDPNGIGNCNTTTGECLKCIYNTGGSHCETCLPGYYGNALALPKGDCKPCQCYPVGTEEDPSGAIVCDQNTGVCNCKSHVLGRNCDQCEDGYYNLQSGEGCHTCNCDPIGSLNQTCNAVTGQCYCRPGVTGLRCDHCEVAKYGFSTDGCKPCECDVIGSKNLQCDPFGQCPCLENVEGRRCDRCKENKYDRHRGCIDCPDCYNLVQDASRSHNNKLNKLTEILNEIEQKPTVITDDQFPDELTKLERDVGTFYDKVKNITGESSITQKVYDIRQREKEISRTLSEIDENIYIVNDKNQRIELNIDHIDHTVIEAEDKLFEIDTYLNTQGKNALDEAVKRSQIAGQQSENMTKIAQEARELADKLEAKADNISLKAKDAKNKSIEAYDVAKKANNEQTQRMDRRIKNLEVPHADIPELKRKSKELREEAYRLANKSEELFHDSEDLRKDVEEEVELGRQLLVKAYDQQDETDELLNEIHILIQKLRRAKKEAEEALQTIDKIDTIIRDTQTKNYEAQQTLLDASENANMALESAVQADTLAKNTSDNLGKIKTEADKLQFNSTGLIEEIDAVEDRVQETEERLEELLRKGGTNDSLINQAKDKVGGARIGTDNVSKKVAELLGNVNSIVDELQNAEDIDEDELERLEAEIKITEERIKEAKLEEKLSDLQKEHISQTNLISQYKIDISRLQKDVENIAQIVAALPDGCFRRVQLEP
ncbi:hypothetical protein NQ318_023162 [Aromia moschata]|uniref:Laminin subunit gamma-1 n=1 Tax=Aromia moschata TaxID=1265417 RepID=A0AAV8X732_9CUCU|nr:hypothetical protein NQ318_023162 [Aromia moschata]